MKLTQKEFNVAYLYSQGRRMKQVAKQNKISLSACFCRIKRVYGKLGVNNSFDLHIWFMEQAV